MNLTLLIEEVLEEVLFEVKEDPTGWDLRRAYKEIEEDSKPFNLKKFISLSPKLRLFYLHTRRDTKFMGEGSSRIVYRIPGNLVLKVAKGEKGAAQNRAEKLAVKCGYPRYYAKVYRAAKDNSWILMEEAERITRQEFRQIMGFTYGELSNALHFVLHADKGEKTPAVERRAYEKLKSDPWFRGLARMMLTCKLEPGDIAKPDSWGADSRGNIVLIDYGLASNVWKQHYS